MQQFPLDPVIKEALASERQRQQDNIELIASENYVSNAVLYFQGSILTNKYAEGYPGRRYYGGCQFIDQIEDAARNYAKQLFGVKYANVQPHSGSSANMAALRALLKPGDKMLSMNLADGGHLTHGHHMSFSGQDYQVVFYNVDRETERINYGIIRELAVKEKPQLILAGASAYSRIIDFDRFREIADEVGAYLMVDMAHIAGLVAAGLHPSPCGVADVVTTTTHKTLRGPRGGMILTNDPELNKKINSAVFPGTQGGPLEHIIAAKAQCFYEALQPEFKAYQQQILDNVQALAAQLKEEGFRLVSDGSDNHMLMVDVKSMGTTGKAVQDLLDTIHITTNKNTIPYDTESPVVTSGVRMGSAAMTTRGLKEDDFRQIGHIIAEAIRNADNAEKLAELDKEVLALTARFPLPYAEVH